MKALILGLVAMIAMTIVGAGAAQAGNGCGTPPVAYAPAPSGAVAQGQGGTGYRAFSYQPGAGYRTYSYQPWPGYRYAPSMRAGRVGTGFADATRKALGNY